MLNFYNISLLLTFALSPILWYGPFGKVMAVKNLFLFIVILFNIKNFLAPKMFVYHLVFLFMTLSYAGIAMYHGNHTTAMVMQQTSLSLVIAYIFFVAGINYEESYDFLKWVYWLLIIYCLPIFTHAIWGFPQWQIPMDIYLDIYPDTLDGIPDLNETGFAFGRTGWSVSIAQIAGLTFILAGTLRQVKDYVRLGVLLLPLLVLQLLSGGRGGIVSTVVLVAVTVLIVSKQKFYPALFMLLIITVTRRIILRFGEFFRLYARDITSGRIDQYMFFIDNIFPNMAFLGFGLVAHETMGLIYDFHNTWLKLFIECGVWVVFFIICMIIIVMMVLKSWRLIFSRPDYYWIPAVLISGFVASLFEPAPIFLGISWQLWWFAAGAAFRLHRLSRESMPAVESHNETLPIQKSPISDV